jgi:phosphoribosylcarboxyaminoimidazole (NCAIR) mutase
VQPFLGSPVQVVDRVVEVDRLVTVVQEVPVTTVPKGAAWPAALAKLAAELDTGRVYDQDLLALPRPCRRRRRFDRRPGWRR